jgi:hypothetical protein
MLTVMMAVECSGLVLNAGVTRHSDLDINPFPLKPELENIAIAA